MLGYLALVLHAHLPFVREPEQERLLEESWLFEALTEAYVPLLEVLLGWERDALPVRLTFSFSPPLCAMLQDPLLMGRCERRLEGLIELAEKETFRTQWDHHLQPVARYYYDRFRQTKRTWRTCGGDLVAAFARLEAAGRLETVTTGATHAVLPLLVEHPPSVRAQVLVARERHRACFGRAPVGFWLPECAYRPELEPVLREADFRWFVVEAHALALARPLARFGVYAPVFTPTGPAAFARDPDSARQVWSQRGGYPGDARYRDFYRDIGFDLDFDYVQPYLPSPAHRGFTGLKYYRITGGDHPEKLPYNPESAQVAVQEHARHFLGCLRARLEQVAGRLDRPPLLVAPFDAELFGHWWHEGPRFLDALVRVALAEAAGVAFVTPTDYLRLHPSNQLAQPGPGSWGEGGHWGVWLNRHNEWVHRWLQPAQERMSQLARQMAWGEGLAKRALRQAARELMLAQASDWTFLMHTGANSSYAQQRVREHLGRFHRLADQLSVGRLDEVLLLRLEQQDNLFPALDCRHWA